MAEARLVCFASGVFHPLPDGLAFALPIRLQKDVPTGSSVLRTLFITSDFKR